MRKIIMVILSVWSCCFLLAGCSSEKAVSLKDGAGIENTMEDGLREMGTQLPDVEPVVEDSWPVRIGRENERTTAENLSFDLVISDPMTLEITCVTENGTLDMEITSGGEQIFSEREIQTETFEVPVTASGTCQVMIQAKEHTGSFWIEPQD